MAEKFLTVNAIGKHGERVVECRAMQPFLINRRPACCLSTLLKGCELVLFGFFVGLIFDPQLALAQADSDGKLLQGTWEVISSEFDGKAGAGNSFVFVHIPNNIGARFTVKGDVIAYTSVGEAKEGRSSFVIRPNVSPKEIDWVHPTPDMAQLGMESCVYRGVYSLQGDTLKLCYVISTEQRPTTFQTTKGDNRTLWTLRRLASTGQKIESDGAANASDAAQNTNKVALDIQKKLIGTWNSTDGGGWVLSFDKEWRITKNGYNAGGGFLLVHSEYGEGKVRYEIDTTGVSDDGSGGKKPAILEFNPQDAKEPMSRWEIDSLSTNKMVLTLTMPTGDKKIPFDRTSAQALPVKPRESPKK